MSEYQVLGTKAGDFKAYQTINYCERLIENLVNVEKEENMGSFVKDHNPTFGKLFSWLKLAISTRRADITSRLAHSQKAREERSGKMAAAEERSENRKQFIADSEEQFNKDHEAEKDAYDAYMQKKAEVDG